MPFVVVCGRLWLVEEGLLQKTGQRVQLIRLTQQSFGFIDKFRGQVKEYFFLYLKLLNYDNN